LYSKAALTSVKPSERLHPLCGSLTRKYYLKVSSDKRSSLKYCGINYNSKTFTVHRLHVRFDIWRKTLKLFKILFYDKVLARCDIRIKAFSSKVWLQRRFLRNQKNGKGMPGNFPWQNLCIGTDIVTYPWACQINFFTATGDVFKTLHFLHNLLIHPIR
jgi:hypothetical protein